MLKVYEVTIFTNRCIAQVHMIENLYRHGFHDSVRLDGSHALLSVTIAVRGQPLPATALFGELVRSEAHLAPSAPSADDTFAEQALHADDTFAEQALHERVHSEVDLEPSASSTDDALAKQALHGKAHSEVHLGPSAPIADDAFSTTSTSSGVLVLGDRVMPLQASVGVMMLQPQGVIEQMAGSLPIPGMNRGESTSKNLSWTLFGFDRARGAFQPHDLMQYIGFPPDVKVRMNQILVALRSVPPFPTASQNCIVKAWQSIAEATLEDRLVYPVLMCHAYLNFLEIEEYSDTWESYFFVKDPAHFDFGMHIRDFIRGTRAVLSGLGVMYEQSSATPAQSMVPVANSRQQNLHLIMSTYPADNLLEAQWCSGARLQ